MGADALKGNGITIKLLYLIRDKTLTSPDDPLHKVRKSRLLMFVAIQLVAFGATFVVTQSIGKSFVIYRLRFYFNFGAAAIGFPVIILLLVPLRTYVIPRLPFTQEELSILDGPTASPFVSSSPLRPLKSSCARPRRWNLSADLYTPLDHSLTARSPTAHCSRV
jgi:hypothetical protein